MKLIVYRLLSIVLIIDILAIISTLTLGYSKLGLLLGILAVIILIVQVFIIKCGNCGTRPGLWLFAIWTLLLDYELYLLDTLMLKKCPKCNESLNRKK